MFGRQIYFLYIYSNKGVKMIKLKTLISEGAASDANTNISKKIAALDDKFKGLKKTADSALKELKNTEPKIKKFITAIEKAVIDNGYTVKSVRINSHSENDYWVIHIEISINTANDKLLMKILEPIAKAQKPSYGSAYYMSQYHSYNNDYMSGAWRYSKK